MSVWQTLEQKYTALQHREKVMILAVGVFCLVYLTYWFAILPNSEQGDKTTAQIGSLSSEVSMLEAQQSALQQAISVDYKGKLQQQISALETDIDKLDLHIQSLSDGFIAAERMPDVLQSLLAQQPGLELIGFEVLGPTPVDFSPQESATKSSEQKGVQTQNTAPQGHFYQHNMTITLRGEYFTLRDYLTHLENATYKVLITGFDYQVSEYPYAELTLSIATVSSNETFITL